ncbi:shikimate kinase [uncultured Desulfovibrio sp.]|uniref:shikimate kinase n=1 Tax=uncultured Desulfovibrio sp. TaxID=167968 RepID=UPI0026244DB3|nr:shikimate kinase [uncultured Desulfovibrio sp.]
MLIYLTGPRACGKTSLGRSLAAALGLPFVDTDHYLRERSGEEVAAIVAREGWEGFRRRESAILREVAAELENGPATAETAAQDAPSAWRGVVATGGGMVLAEENRRFMRETGRVFFLDVPVAELVRRLSRNPLEAQRPSLTGKSLTEEVADVLAQRLPLYEEAHHRLDAARPLRDVRAQALALLSGNAGA